jgi:replication factor A2
MDGASAYTSQSRAPTNQFAGLPTLQRSIMEFLTSQPYNDEGVHVGAIARAVGGEAGKIRSGV